MGKLPPERSVAIIDDDESVCRSLARLLRASGIRSEYYSSAEAFLEDGRGDDFDCLILDLHLGGMSGIELQESLAKSGSPMPVIFITAHDEPDMRERAIRCGCVAYLSKSAPFSTVLAAVAAAASPLGERRIVS